MNNSKEPIPKRASGVLLHPTSLPGPYGIGDLGPEAHAFIDSLANAGQSYWQVLPLGPVASRDFSPYDSLSAHAGNPLLISPDLLWRQGLLADATLRISKGDPTQINYPAAASHKTHMLETAFSRFHKTGFNALKTSFDSFRQEHAPWLETYARFQATCEAEQGRSWHEWQQSPTQWEQARGEDFRQRIEFHAFCQFLFFSQWRDLKQYAHERGVRIVGDLPIYVSYDSTDLWQHPELFKLDEVKRPSAWSGVPPDRFTATGQFWGTPVHDWPVHAAQNFTWWIDRFRTNLALFDLIRIDHFRGFEAYWEIPGGETTAENGQWIKAPGAELFETLSQTLGTLPAFAEDLGVITPEVIALRERFQFPGVHVLQFAFEEMGDGPLPQPAERCVVYTGTHDNNTSRGWFETEAEPNVKRRFLEHTGSDGQEPHWDFIRLAMDGPARLAIIPLQDIMGLGGEARMNHPGRLGESWRWRFEKTMLKPGDLERLAELTVQTRR